MRINWFRTLAFAVVLAACGGSSAVESAAGGDDVEQSTTPPVEDVAALNTPMLQTADDPIDVEVLAVSDGSVASLRKVADGDRPVLLWFYAPH
jgi:hypothetical protein